MPRPPASPGAEATSLPWCRDQPLGATRPTLLRSGCAGRTVNGLPGKTVHKSELMETQIRKNLPIAPSPEFSYVAKNHLYFRIAK